MDIINTPTEDILKHLLQRQLSFVINDRVVKKGKLILFKQNNYCVDLNLKQQTDDERLVVYTIPLPFFVTQTSRCVLFDYRLALLVGNNVSLLNMIRAIPPARRTKFYDATLTINMETL